MKKYRFIKAKEAIKHLPKFNKIHCFTGFLGADWSRKEVIKEIKRAKKVAWTPNIFRHELAIEPNEKSGWDCVLHFDVLAPNIKRSKQ